MARLVRAMERFNQRFRPDDSIGCADGIHHGTASIGEDPCLPWT
jgi:hypothetical protein